MEGADHQASTASGPANPRGAKQRHGAVRGVLGLTALLVIAAVVVTASRPDWPRSVWDASGIGCGRGLETVDAESPWTAWATGSETAQRREVADLAERLDPIPVGTITATTAVPGIGPSATVTVTPQGDLLRVETRSPGWHRIMIVDPAGGTPRWTADLRGADDSWGAPQQDQLVIGQRPLARGGSQEGRFTDIITVNAATGARGDCARVDGWPGYGGGDGEAALLVDTETRGPGISDDEQPAVGTRSPQQITLPGLDRGFQRTLPPIESPSAEASERTRPHPAAADRHAAR